MTNFRPLYIFLAALAVITAYVVYDAKYNYVNWRTANRSSAGIAPSPLKEKEAVVQVYAAALTTGAAILPFIRGLR